jgi:hypothetical protein
LKQFKKKQKKKIKSGMDETMAQMSVMMKHKSQIAKYQNELMPLMQLMQGMK